jgi:hypothetical protein
MAKSKVGSSGSRANRITPPIGKPELTRRSGGSSFPVPPKGTWPIGGAWPPFATFPPYGTWPVGATWPIGAGGKPFPARPPRKKGAAFPVWSVRPQWPSKVERSAQLWEYALIEAHGPRNLGDALGAMGRGGWEAVNFVMEQANQYLVLLKRPANIQVPKGKR